MVNERDSSEARCDVNRRNVLHSIGAGVGAFGIATGRAIADDGPEVRVETTRQAPVQEMLKSSAVKKLRREMRDPQLGDGPAGHLDLHVNMAERTLVYVDGTLEFDTVRIPAEQGILVCDVDGNETTFLFDDARYPAEVHDASEDQDSALIVQYDELLFSRDASDDELEHLADRLGEDPAELTAVLVRKEHHENAYRIFGADDAEVLEVDSNSEAITVQTVQPNSCAVPCGLCAAAVPICAGCALACKTGIGVPACLKCLFTVCGIDAASCYSCYNCIA